MAWDDEDLVTGAVPLWFQISERLIAALEKGEFSIGDVLPSETQLIRRFGVSRTTARAALDHLETQGLVERRSGKGSTVLPPRVDQPLNLLSSFTEDMRARGLEPGYDEIDVRVVRCTAAVAAELDLTRGTRVVQVSRLLLASGEPMGVSESWLAPSVVPARPDAASNLPDSSLYAWLEEENGIRIGGGSEVIEAGVAGTELARRLHIEPGGPVLIARRTARDDRGKPVEHAYRCYRADRYRYRIELSRR